jgi:hypothetical protein
MGYLDGRPIGFVWHNPPGPQRRIGFVSDGPILMPILHKPPYPKHLRPILPDANWVCFARFIVWLCLRPALLNWLCLYHRPPPTDYRLLGLLRTTDIGLEWWNDGILGYPDRRKLASFRTVIPFKLGLFVPWSFNRLLTTDYRQLALFGRHEGKHRIPIEFVRLVPFVVERRL